jgi:hypothetical protein
LPGRDQRCWSREGRETLLRAPAASATRAGGVCYMRRRPLLHVAVAAATLAGVGCYHGCRRLLPYGHRQWLLPWASAMAATSGAGICYMWRRPLLHVAAAAVATLGGGGCYHGRLRLLHRSAMAATSSAGVCYKRSAAVLQRISARPAAKLHVQDGGAARERPWCSRSARWYCRT